MSPQEVASAIRFGRHVAKATGSETLANYSHNGIGTKACLNFFSRLAIYSVHPAPADASAGGGAALTSTLLLLDVADKHGDGVCKQALQIVWQGVVDQEKLPPAQQEDARRLCAQLSYLPPARRRSTNMFYNQCLSRSQPARQPRDYQFTIFYKFKDFKFIIYYLIDHFKSNSINLF